jgi:glycosyltransferase involved in cell wall biosynthesis
MGPGVPPADGAAAANQRCHTSYNQGQFIERTLRSVLLQGYPNLEYLIIDGASRDETCQVLGRYAQHLDYWVSEPDRGQSHAINKGFARTTGEIVCWLNSDDCFLPGALQTVGRTLASSTGNLALVGNCLRSFDNGNPTIRVVGHYEPAPAARVLERLPCISRRSSGAAGL